MGFCKKVNLLSLNRMKRMKKEKKKSQQQQKSYSTDYWNWIDYMNHTTIPSSTVKNKNKINK